MKKILLTTILILSVSFSWSQRDQIIAYIDMEYILENVPEYITAQNTLNEKVAKWKKILDKEARHIEVLKSDLANEKAILTNDLIEEKEEEITLKQDQLRKLESLYFGPQGDLFSLRKQLVKPIQDQVYNAIQSISAKKKYDFVFDKSSELVMLYSNKKYDISDLVLATIDRTRLVNQKKNLKQENNKPSVQVTKQQQKEIDKNKALIAKQLSAKEAQKKALEEKKKQQLKAREEKRELLRKKKEALKKKREEAKKKKQEENKKEDQKNK